MGGALVFDNGAPAVPTVVRDVSETGLCVVTAPGVLGQRWLVSFGFEVDGALCSGSGRVVRISGGGSYGVELDDVSDTFRSFVRTAEAACQPKDVLRSARALQIRVG